MAKKRKKGSNAEQTRLAIIDAGVALFHERGSHATAVRDVVERAGITKGAFYHHFDSKESILRAIIAGNFRRVLESLDQRLDGIDDPRLAFDVFVENHVAFFTGHLAEMRVMAHELDTLGGEAGEEVAGLRRAYTERARSILHALRPERPENELRIDALCLFGMLIWTYRWFHTLDEKVGVDRLAGHMAELYLEGFMGAAVAR